MKGEFLVERYLLYKVGSLFCEFLCDFMILGTASGIEARNVSLEVGNYIRVRATIRSQIAPTNPKIFNLKVFMLPQILKMVCMSAATPQGHTSLC